MTQQATFTDRARRDCLKIDVDEDEARDVIENPDYERQHHDLDDPNTVFTDSVRQLPKDYLLVVTWEQLADRRLVYRVFLIHRDEPNECLTLRPPR